MPFILQPLLVFRRRKMHGWEKQLKEFFCTDQNDNGS